MGSKSIALSSIASKMGTVRRRGISKARPDIPIHFVSDCLEVQLQVCFENQKDAAIEELSRCVREVIERDVHGRIEDLQRRIPTGWTNVESRPLHDVLERVVVASVIEEKNRLSVH